MNYYKYSRFKITNVCFTNMVRCRARKENDTIHVLKEIFGDEIPF